MLPPAGNTPAIFRSHNLSDSGRDRRILGSPSPNSTHPDMADIAHNFLPTVIVVHPRENRKKCSVEPLRGRAGFQFEQFRSTAPAPLPAGSYVRLGIGGPILSPADQSSGLLVLDGTWRWAEAMEAQYQGIPVRSLPPWKTAYPRVSKVFEDPATGLATIEAIWLAYWCLGRDTTGLLDAYRWGDQFLELNRAFHQPANTP